jgi:hypothetical protein
MTPMTRRLFAFAWLLPSLLALAGCGKSPVTVPAPTTEAKLTEIGQMYRDFTKDHKKAPQQLADFDLPYEPANINGYAALRDGECVMIWGGKLPGPNAGATVLAYEKSAPESGGLVLFQDGTIRTVTADEFKAAPKVK